MMRIGFDGKSSAKACGAMPARSTASAAPKSLRTGWAMVVLLVKMGVAVGGVPMVVVVHELLRHAREERSGGGRRGARPFDAALLQRRREEIVPGEERRVARDLEALGERGQHQLADAPSVPA